MLLNTKCCSTATRLFSGRANQTVVAATNSFRLASNLAFPTTNSTDQLFTALEPHEITPKRKYPLAGVKLIQDSHGKGFPKFLAAPRKDFPHALKVKNADQLSISEWAQHCRRVLEGELPKYGVVLFRGLPLNESQHFSSFTSHLGYTPMEYTGGTSDRPIVDKEALVFESALDSKEFYIQPHSEMAYSNTYPRKVMFYCDQSPAEGCGGLTPVARNSEVLAKLDPKVVQKFEQKQICYSRNLPDEGKDVRYNSWQSAFYTDDKKVVEKSLEKAGYSYKWNTSENSLMFWYTLPAVRVHPVTGDKIWFNQADLHHCSYWKNTVYSDVTLEHDYLYLTHSAYGDGTAIEPQVLEHIGKVGWQCTVGFEWQNGDVMVIDNLAAMHARLSFAGKRRILAFLTSD